MNKRIWTRFALMLSVVILLTSLVVPKAEAASMTTSAWMPTVTTNNFVLSLGWNAVPGAAYYQVRYATNPNPQLSTSGLYSTTDGTSVYSTMAGSIGYRYFRIYAYNSSGTLLSYSNVVAIAKYPSGLVVRMKQDWALTNSYPDPNGVYAPNLYQKPVWFIPVTPEVTQAYVAPNFQMGEFIHQSGLTSALVDPMMVQHIQDARYMYGAPMVVESGYRTPGYNASIGGSKYSRHLYGDAFDVRASSWTQWNALNSTFTSENPSYVESYDEAGQTHWHGDWRYETKGYTDWY